MYTRTVKDEVFALFRRRSLTTIFSNPGSTEVPFLTGLPEDFQFVLGLHEGSVVGMATGWAIESHRAALVVLHTTAGLGNAVGALATARVNRAPLVVLVGQQDRRHLVHEPFLTGRRLELLAGDYPVWVGEPRRPQDLASVIDQAWHHANHWRGPAVVVVPMDDWEATADSTTDHAAPNVVIRSSQVAPEGLGDVIRIVDAARSAALVVGAGADDPASWSATVELAERMGGPVWQEPFGGRAGFPQDHELFAGHLPANRSALRSVLARHDVVVVVGAAAFRQYMYEPGRFLEDGTTLIVVTDDPEEAYRSPATVAVLGSLAGTCAELAGGIHRRDWMAPARPQAHKLQRDGSLAPADVFVELARRLPAESIVVEESPSSRSQLQDLIPARANTGFVSAAMGGLGFALPAAIGLRLASPARPVVAIVGDGSSLYAIQSLWSAVNYRVGALFVILGNGGYAIMDRLATQAGGKGPWPSFGNIDIAALARGFGCDTVEIATQKELTSCLDEVVPHLVSRQDPLVISVAVSRS